MFRRVAKALRFPKQVATGWSVWLLAGLTIGLCSLIAWASRGSRLPRVSRHLAVVLVLASVALLSVGFDVGAAPLRGWAADEITPLDSLFASRVWFSDGWYHRYPPLQFYLLALIGLPFAIGQSFQWFAMTPDVQQLIHVIGRGLSLMMGLLTLVVIWLIGEETIGRPRAIIAACLLTLTPVFVYYSKTTNVDVPALFWLALALLFFVNAAKYRTLVDHMALGGAAALAVSTKDQMYAFFPGVALTLLWLSWRDYADQSPLMRRLAQTIFDRRLWAGAAVCCGVYGVMMGVFWNLSGVRTHFDLIWTASQPFRMYPSSWEGLRQLALTTIGLLPATLGGIAAGLLALGLAVVMGNAVAFRYLWLLLAPVISYVVTFLAVAGYIYDRFLLGVALVAALFAGLGLDWLTSLVRNERLRTLLTGAVLFLALTPSALLDWRLVSDSRLRVERWMEANLLGDPLVLGVGTQKFLPNLSPFAHHMVIPETAEELLAWKADVIVLNEQWLERPPLPGTSAVTATLEQRGYKEAFAVRPATDHAWFQYVLRGGSEIHPSFSNLSKVSPPISVWIRDHPERRRVDY